MRSVALRDTAASIRRSAQDPLGIYLNDHLAGATAGLELARRVVYLDQTTLPVGSITTFL